ncbi:MAG: DNA-directed RNA polymerase subunit alpha [Lentisphaeria bacterium]|nr:DNA-directed RNA polymerase subunit alpha [Lentisphaeria bacterium]
MSAIDGFAMPESLVIDEATATPTYAKFIAEPWEKGFGNTLGNALRRVLLSSLEGVAVSSVRIDGVAHEFSTIPDVLEDVTEIILNLKKLRVSCDGDLPRTLELVADKAGAVTAAAVREDGVTTILNPELHICTLDRDRPVRIELEICKGRGYRLGEQNKRADQPIGVIPIDSLFSPVERMAYDVQQCRVGNRTDYDRLELQVWTDGRVSPEDAVRTAATILQRHLTVFTISSQDQIPQEERLNEEELELLNKLSCNVADMDLSVRAKNCLQNAEIDTVGTLVSKAESEMLKFRNFGKKSLDEIKEKLALTGLALEMPVAENVAEALRQRREKLQEED